MKKIIFLTMLFFTAQAEAHLILDAGLLSKGTLNSARLDPSSVTLLGPLTTTPADGDCIQYAAGGKLKSGTCGSGGGGLTPTQGSTTYFVLYGTNGVTGATEFQNSSVTIYVPDGMIAFTVRSGTAQVFGVLQTSTIAIIPGNTLYVSTSLSSTNMSISGPGALAGTGINIQNSGAAGVSILAGGVASLTTNLTNTSVFAPILMGNSVNGTKISGAISYRGVNGVLWPRNGVSGGNNIMLTIAGREFFVGYSSGMAVFGNAGTVPWGAVTVGSGPADGWLFAAVATGTPVFNIFGTSITANVSTTFNSGTLGSVIVGTVPANISTAFVQINSTPGSTLNAIQASTDVGGANQTDYFIVGPNGVLVGTVPFITTGQVLAKAYGTTVKPAFGFLQRPDDGLGLDQTANSLYLITTNTKRLQVDSAGTVAQSGVIGTLGVGSAITPAISMGNGMGLSGPNNNDIAFILTPANMAGRIDNSGWWNLSGTHSTGVPTALVQISSFGAEGSILRPIILIAVSTGSGTDNAIDIARITTSSGVINVPLRVKALNINSNPSRQSQFDVGQSSYNLVIATSSINQVAVSSNGYILSASSATRHAVSNCGTSVIRGGGSAFELVVSGGPTACTITYAVPFDQPPIIQITQQQMSVVNALTLTAISEKGFTINQVGLANLYITLNGFTSP